ncbi:terminase, ATPase subunit domain protein, partial [Escherichia coli EC1865]
LKNRIKQAVTLRK